MAGKSATLNGLSPRELPSILVKDKQVASQAKTTVGVRFDSPVVPPSAPMGKNPVNRDGAGPSERKPDSRRSRRSRSRGRSVSTTRAPAAAGVSSDAKQPQRSWASVARSAEKGYNLSYFPPAFVDDKPVVRIPSAVLKEANPKWSECLVGYYVGKRLPFKLTETSAKNAWGAHLVDVMANDDGFYFFHIPDSSFRSQILDSGSFTIARVPLILQQWHPRLELKREAHDSLPVWVRLKSIPYALWSPSGVGYIASAIGKPLHVDLHTEKLSRISFARACIAVRANQPLHDSVVVECEDIKCIVEVEFEGKPSSCSVCGRFGHKCAAAAVSDGHSSPAPSGNVMSPILPSPVPSGNVLLPVLPSPAALPPVDDWKKVSRRKSRSKNRSEPPISATSVVLEPLKTPVEAAASSAIQNPLFSEDAGDGLSSRSSDPPSSDSEEEVGGDHSNVGSDEEDSPPSPAHPVTRRRSALHLGDSEIVKQQQPNPAPPEQMSIGMVSDRSLSPARKTKPSSRRGGSKKR